MIAVIGMIAYIEEWTIVFYSAASIITLAWLTTVIMSFFFNNSWLKKLYPIGISAIYVLAGHIITNDWLFGALFGFCFSPFVGMVEYLTRNDNSYSK